MANLVVAGVMRDNGELADIKVEVDTGLCVLFGTLIGTCIISDISAEKPINIDADGTGVDPAVAEKIMNQYACDGYVMAGDYLITLKDGVANYRNYADGKVLETIAYDTSMDYDEAEY